MGRFLLGVLAGSLCAALAMTAAPPAYDWRLPTEVAPPPVPADNPMSAAKVALGRRLFYDADLSVDGTTSCGTCHEQSRGFTDGNATHPGVGDALGRRNPMGLANVAYFNPLTWADPSEHSLEQQIRTPVFGIHPIEMGMAGDGRVLAARLGSDSCYRSMFRAAFPEENGRINSDSAAKAIAAFERTLLSFDAPFDRFKRGDASAMRAAAKQGLDLFLGARFHCGSCHAGPNFTDSKFHNIDTGTAADSGAAEITGRAADRDAFRTPSLRNATVTAPYLHDGSAKDLAAAIQRHASAGLPEPMPQDTADLIAFIGTLTDRHFLADARFGLPATACGKPL